MKKFSLVLFVLCCLTGGKLFAQDTLQVTSQQIALTILEKIDHEVSLSKQQKDKVLTLLTERSKKIEKIKSTSKAKNLSEESLTAVNQGSYNQLKKILTDEQFKRLQALREDTERQKEKYGTDQVYLSEQDVELDF